MRRDKEMEHKADFKVKDDYMALKSNNKAWTGCHNKVGWVKAVILLRLSSGQLLSVILHSVQPTMLAEGSMVNSGIP